MGRRQAIGIVFAVIMLAVAVATIGHVQRAPTVRQALPSGNPIDVSNDGVTLAGEARFAVLRPAGVFLTSLQSGIGAPLKMDASGRPNQGTVKVVLGRYPDLRSFRSYSFGRTWTYNDGLTVDVDVVVATRNGTREQYSLIMLRNASGYQVAVMF